MVYNELDIKAYQIYRNYVISVNYDIIHIDSFVELESRMYSFYCEARIELRKEKIKKLKNYDNR